MNRNNERSDKVLKNTISSRKDYHGAFYSNICALLVIIILLPINLVKNGSFDIQLLTIFIAGEAGREFYRYSRDKKTYNLLLGIICIVITISGIILYI